MPSVAVILTNGKVWAARHGFTVEDGYAKTMPHGGSVAVMPALVPGAHAVTRSQGDVSKHGFSFNRYPTPSGCKAGRDGTGGMSFHPHGLA
jgi:hypothetical protein